MALGGSDGRVEHRESLVPERAESDAPVMATGVKEALPRAAEVAESGTGSAGDQCIASRRGFERTTPFGSGDA